MSGITHIAGVHVSIGERLRQRCAWCGAVLIDYNLANIAVPIGQDPTPATWEVGALIMMDGNMSMVIEPADRLPDDACGRLDPEVTL